MIAATYADRWPAKPDRFRVACYVGNFADSPVIYSGAVAFDHRTLKAAARRLAHLIARQSRSGYVGARYDSLYIVTPEGERLALRSAQARIAESVK